MQECQQLQDPTWGRDITLIYLSTNDTIPDNGDNVLDPAPGILPLALVHVSALDSQLPGGIISPSYGCRLASL